MNRVSDAPSRKDKPKDGLMLFALATLQHKDTWAVVVVVGTVINLYGQLLVPYLHNRKDPVAQFLARISYEPGATALGIVVAYLFPTLVTMVTGALSQQRSIHFERLAALPNHKPDPVFQVDATGKIITMGAITRALFERHLVKRASDVLGQENWTHLTTLNHNQTPAPFNVTFGGCRYCVTTSTTPAGARNIYLSAMVEDIGDEL